MVGRSVPATLVRLVYDEPSEDLIEAGLFDEYSEASSKELPSLAKEPRESLTEDAPPALGDGLRGGGSRVGEIRVKAGFDVSKVTNLCLSRFNSAMFLSTPAWP